MLITTAGTDHPFFPPLDEEDTQWLSVQTNSQAVQAAFPNGYGSESQGQTIERVMGGNACKVLKLHDLGSSGTNTVFQ